MTGYPLDVANVVLDHPQVHAFEGQHRHAVALTVRRLGHRNSSVGVSWPGATVRRRPAPAHLGQPSIPAVLHVGAVIVQGQHAHEVEVAGPVDEAGRLGPSADSCRPTCRGRTGRSRAVYAVSGTHTSVAWPWCSAHGAGAGVPPALQRAGASRAGQRAGGEVGLGPSGVGDPDHRHTVGARRTSMVYQHHRREGVTWCGSQPGPGLPARGGPGGTRPATMTTCRGGHAYSGPGRLVRRHHVVADQRLGHRAHVVTEWSARGIRLRGGYRRDAPDRWCRGI